MKDTLNGKIALVTGGGRGIGAAIALRLAGLLAPVSSRAPGIAAAHALPPSFPSATAAGFFFGISLYRFILRMFLMLRRIPHNRTVLN